MLTRRSFVLGACCAGHAAAIGECFADTEKKIDNVFVCSTIDPGPLNGFSIDKYKADVGEAPSIDTSIKNFSMTSYGTSFMRDRWLRSDGLTPNTGIITLGVNFINGNSYQKDLVRSSASAWTAGKLAKRLAFEYDVPPSSSQIRVLFDAGVNDSYVGRDNLKISKTASTLRLQDLAPHVIQHEFGHALGLQHEQQFPDNTIQWDEKAVINEMAGPPNYWDETQTRQNILAKYKSKDAVCVGDPSFNKKSIMLYPIPSSWTLNGFSVGTNASISDRDFACLGGLYGV
ncbi:hypothetical protein AU375_03341 [Methylobacterium radiotolerans]|nr:hypothetical protein AU375_03341 [Methylobacterium radiotolerans]